MENKGTNDWVELIKTNADIVSTVSKYITLQKKGKTWWACCPFHYEKTPSFAINEYEQYYHCFGCGASGDLITFVQKYENVDFAEACRIIAEQNNITLPEQNFDDNIAKRKKKVDRLYSMMKDAAKYYFNNLKTPQGKPAIEYLESRKLNNETINAFGIGYSLGWNEIITYLKSKGYSYEEMLEGGVIAKRDDGSYYDCYAKRLIFPLFNAFGNVLGFSARILEKKDFAKYKNTAQTLIFDKSRCVYGINLVKKFKQENPLNEIIIVEGQIDVISLYKCGIKNAVACLGTALTNLHAKELKKLTDKIVLCFDGDGAGVKATLRSIETLVSNGFNVFVAQIPNNADPDEFVNQYGKEKFEQIISNAKYWVEFLILKYAKDYNLNKLEEKNKFIIECLNVIKNLQTESEKDIYLKLVHSLSGVSVAVLKGDMQSETPQLAPKENDNEQLSVNRENAYVKGVKFVLNALLNKKPYAKLSQDIKDNILNSDYKKIYEYVEENTNNGQEFKIGTLFTMFDVENNPDINGLISFEIKNEQDNEKQYDDCVKTLIKTGLAMRQSMLTEKLKETTDENEKREIKMQMLSIINKLNSFKK